MCLEVYTIRITRSYIILILKPQIFYFPLLSKSRWDKSVLACKGFGADTIGFSLEMFYPYIAPALQKEKKTTEWRHTARYYHYMWVVQSI